MVRRLELELAAATSRSLQSLTASTLLSLSFSASFPLGLAQKGLRDLRAALPAPVGLWAGGQGLRRSHDVFGVKIMRGFEELQSELSAWRAARNGAHTA